jgi:hypothetical protein
VGSYTSGYLRNVDRISYGQLPGNEVALMPTTLSTTVKHIHDKVPNSANSKIIADFHQYMIINGTSQNMIDSPYHPYADIRFTVNERGVDDMKEKPMSKRRNAN